jgi:TonB family protein
MTEAWKRYEGQIVDGKFLLGEYFGGAWGSAVFLTGRGEGGAERAAIKLIVEDTGSGDTQLSRWKHAAKLANPNLLKLFEAGRCKLGEADFIYVVMEYADEDLSQILPQRALTVEETREMLGPVLDGLAYLHGKGFVHGRLKPANIMAIADRIKLSIDGVRRTGEENLGHHAASGYDAPEAATEKASPAADVWSLGMTLVEVMTQHLPPWERMGQKDPQIQEELPAPLLDIIRNCLRRDPRSRLTVQGIAARLKAGSPVLTSQAVAPPVAAAKGVREAPAIAEAQGHSSKSSYVSAAIGVAVVLALIFGVTRFISHGAKAKPDPVIASEPAAAVQPNAEPAPEAAETEKPATSNNEEKPAAAEPLPAPAQAPAPAPPPPRSEVAEKPASDAAQIRSEVVHQVIPDAAKSASDTISGTVKVSVRVDVDAKGNVAEASLDSPGPSKYFANLAVQAARRWTFSPAQAGGEAVSSEWEIRFEFTRDGAKAFPVRGTSKTE